jgi:RNA polymerase sigma-70 factor (ECF subfamily)
MAIHCGTEVPHMRHSWSLQMATVSLNPLKKITDCSTSEAGRANALKAPTSRRGQAPRKARGIEMFVNQDDDCSDIDLVDQAREGDKQAFGELIKRHHHRCVSLASCILQDRGEAEDEAQNAYWKAFEHLDQFQGDADFSIWLSRIVVNQCLMFMRAKRRTRFLYLDAGIAGFPGASIELPSWRPDPEGEVGSRQVKEVLNREIRCMPALLRNVLLLRDVEELPIAEVANRLGITIPAAKSRLLRARQELRQRLLRHCSLSGHVGLDAGNGKDRQIAGRLRCLG